MGYSQTILTILDRKAWVDLAKASPQAVFVVPAGVLPTLAEELPIPRGEICRHK
jgi:hypothetical protein